MDKFTTFNYSLIEQEIIRYIQNFVQQQNKQRVVVGLSGGIDSSLVCVLATKALGPENVKALIVENKRYSLDMLQKARLFAFNLGIQAQEINTQNLNNSLLRYLNIDPGNIISATTLDARICDLLIRTVAMLEDRIYLGTINGTERLTGWYPKAGLVGDCCPIGGLLKSQEKELALYMGLKDLIETVSDDASRVCSGCGELKEFKDISFETLDQVLYFYETSKSDELYTKLSQNSIKPETYQKIINRLNQSKHKNTLFPEFYQVNLSDKIFDTIIVGGGAAGVAAACYTARCGLKNMILTQDIGGQVNFTGHISSNISAGVGIDSRKLVENYKKSLESESVPVIFHKVQKVIKQNGLFKVESSNGKNFFSRTVIIATGRGPKKIELPFDQSITQKRINYFTDYPYNNLKNSKKILIIGGGYCALDAVNYLKDFCDQIYIVEKRDKLGGNRRRRDLITGLSHVQIFLNTTIEKIYQQDGQKHAQLKQEFELKDIVIDEIFIAVGTSANTDFLEGVKKNEKEELVIKLSKEPGQMYMTSQQGMFACGDCSDMPAKGFEPLSAGQGIQCAKTVINYLGR